MANPQNKAKPYSRLLSAEEVADYLGLSVRTIWSMSRAGQLPCYRVNNQYRYRLHEIDRWIDKKKQKCRIPERPILADD